MLTRVQANYIRLKFTLFLFKYLDKREYKLEISFFISKIDIFSS